MIRWKNALGAVALVGATMVVTTQVVSMQHEKDMAAEMAKWKEWAKPGPEHQKLMKAEGSWTGENKCWMNPEATEPQVSTSTSEFKSILGGRYLTQKVRGTMDMGEGPQEFEGFGVYGFDNSKKKYFYTWFDNQGTGVMHAEGTANATGDEITYFGECIEGMEMKTVSKTSSGDKHTVEMYSKEPDGKWRLVMQINSTRKK